METLPDEVSGALGTCVASMTQLRVLHVYQLQLQVLKTLPERVEPLGDLTVVFPGVNFVSSNVYCQCVHNTVLIVAVQNLEIGWLVRTIAQSTVIGTVLHLMW